MKPTAHLDLAHKYWKDFLKKEDTAIDATCGNGHDSLVLAQIVSHGHLFCYDIQEKAIQETKQRLEGLSSKVVFFQKSHTDFSDISQPIRLIVYNLGYLPLSDKTITTRTDTTLISVKSALDKIASGGAVSITCYPGHEEGEKEEKALLEILRALPTSYSICYHQWPNRPKSPSLFWVRKSTIK
ncbi:MAG TPA: class I SAM-dependent methyltransferase [Chlamydiales bacterium]|nr:class I SAM-dependent methyltransferase [Chlamydiales bacterium]